MSGDIPKSVSLIVIIAFHDDYYNQFHHEKVTSYQNNRMLCHSAVTSLF